MIGVQPYAMVLAGGERGKTTTAESGINVEVEGEGTVSLKFKCATNSILFTYALFVADGEGLFYVL